jgi:hypothetical protein
LKRKGVALTATAGAASGGIVGYIIGRLSSADLRSIIEKVIDLFKEQGPYAFYALLSTVLFAGLLIWLITWLVRDKNKEIRRISAERDKFQKLFIDDWKSTHKDDSK